MGYTLYGYNLIRCSTDEDIDRSLVLVELFPEILPDKRVRFCIKAVFNGIDIRKRGLRDKSFFIGSQGGKVELSLEDCEITEFTESSNVNVDFEAARNRSQKGSVNFSEQSGYCYAGGISVEMGRLQAHRSSFQMKERLINASKRGNRVRWDIPHIREGNFFQEFLNDTLQFEVLCNWNGECLNGIVSVVPYTCDIFDSTRQRLSLWKQLAFELHLRKQGKVVGNRLGVTAPFRLEKTK